MKRVISFIFLVLILISLCSCSGLKITSEIEGYIELYKKAIENTTVKQQGEVKVTSVTNDNAIEFTTTTSLIEFDYYIKDDKVVFNRNDHVNDELLAVYICNGDEILVKNDAEAEFKDATKQNESFLYVDKNPFITLSLFRVDSNGKIDSSVLNNIKQYTEDEYTVVEFVLSDKAVSTVLGYTKADGVVRKSSGHTRKYYIDSNNNVCKIQIDASQKIISNGVEGDYITSMTVEIS